MGNKYFTKIHPSFVLSNGASLTWRKMIQVREDIEPYMWWQIKGDNSSFRFDNWTKVRPCTTWMVIVLLKRK